MAYILLKLMHTYTYFIKVCFSYFYVLLIHINIKELEDVKKTTEYIKIYDCWEIKYKVSFRIQYVQSSKSNQGQKYTYRKRIQKTVHIININIEN